MRDLRVTHVALLFSFSYRSATHQCALIRSLPFKDDRPDKDTSMWIVECPWNEIPQVIPLDSIYRAAHLIPVYHGVGKLPRNLSADNSLNHFCYYYVNKFANHHAFEILHNLS